MQSPLVPEGDSRIVSACVSPDRGTPGLPAWKCCVVQLRAESVSGQLDGTIPLTDSAQTSSDELIDTSGIDISIMGGMGGGRGGEQKENAAPGNGNAVFEGSPDGSTEGMQTPPELPGAFADDSTSTQQGSSQDAGTSSGTELPENPGSAIGDDADNTQQTSEEQSTSEAAANTQDRGNFRPGNFGGNAGNGQQDFPGGRTDTGSSGSSADSGGLVSLLVSTGVIAAGLVFAVLFRANRR